MKDTDSDSVSAGDRAHITRIVLVVEDDAGLCQLIQKSLQRDGFSTESASNGAEAIAYTIENPDMLLLMDYRLPDMVGTQIIEALAQRQCEVPFIAMTGYGDERIAVEMMKLGARDYLVKDKEFLELLPSVVGHVMDQLRIEGRLTRAEAALKEKQHLNALLLNSLPHPAMLIRKDKTILAANRIAQEIGAKIDGYCWHDFGQSEFIPEQDKEYIKNHNEFPPGGTHCSYCLANEALESGEPRQAEVKARDKLWDTYWIPLNDEIYLNYAIDVTRRKRMEEELLKIEKLESIGVLAGGIAHDLNNMLTSVMGNISLARIYEDPSKKDRRLTQAEGACMHIKDLTQQLLTFSKGGAPILKIADIGDLLKDSATFTLRGSNVRCEFSIPDDLWPVEIDDGQMSQVINNLVINAKQAMPTGGVVKVCAENTTIAAESGFPLKAGAYVKISVEDEGTGIPDKYMQRIFDPFFTTKQEGNGLGLATSYSIIQKHNGHITLESEPGIGTTFYIYLPTSTEAVLPERRATAVAPIMGEGRILVMDDEEHVRDMSATILSELGYEVTTGVDGAEAVELYQKARESGKPYDAVILDLTVPGGMGGQETIQKLLEIDPKIKALVSSGYSNDPVLANFREHGFIGFIPKPCKIQELSEIVHKIMTGNPTI